MKLALFAALLAFAAPVPAVESFTLGADEEVIVESARTAKAPLRREPAGPPRLPPQPSSPRPALEFDPGLPLLMAADWPPRLFSRPPPL